MKTGCASKKSLQPYKQGKVVHTLLFFFNIHLINFTRPPIPTERTVSGSAFDERVETARPLHPKVSWTNNSVVQMFAKLNSTAYEIGVEFTFSNEGIIIAAAISGHNIDNAIATSYNVIVTWDARISDIYAWRSRLVRPRACDWKSHRR
jgi:hypothetical protein